MRRLLKPITGFDNNLIRLTYGRKIFGNFAALPEPPPPANLTGMTHDPLEIRHLRYFLAVAEAGSFSRAAQRLAVSQPNISQQIRDLETTLRVDLFQRRGKRILLTPAGKIFEGHARSILREIENFLQELSTEPGQMRGALHLGVVPILNVAFIPQLLGDFAATHPGVRLTVEEISSTEIETALEEGRMDVGLGFLTRHSPNLHYERLCTDQFALIVHKSHKWARAAPSTSRTAPGAHPPAPRYFRHAPDVGRDLSRAPGPAAQCRRDQRH